MAERPSDSHDDRENEMSLRSQVGLRAGQTSMIRKAARLVLLPAGDRPRRVVALGSNGYCQRRACGAKRTSMAVNLAGQRRGGGSHSAMVTVHPHRHRPIGASCLHGPHDDRFDHPGDGKLSP